MANPDRLIIPTSRANDSDRFDQDIQIIELHSSDDAYRITESAQGTADHDRRTIKLQRIRNPFNTSATDVLVYTESKDAHMLKVIFQE